jgi:hypothetical protein
MKRHPALTVLMVVIGIVLLMPGFCALLFMAQPSFGSDMVVLWMLCFLVSAGGVLLIWRALR